MNGILPANANQTDIHWSKYKS